MKRLRSRSVIVAIATFLVVTATSFLLWPIEKASYAGCSPLEDCAGKYSSEIGGGLFYVQHINQTEDAVSESYVRLYFDEKSQSSYAFSPVIVLVSSVGMGLGIAVIATICNRVIARRILSQANMHREEIKN